MSTDYFTPEEFAEATQVAESAQTLLEDLSLVTFDIAVYDGNGATIATIQCYDGLAHIILGAVNNGKSE